MTNLFRLEDGRKIERERESKYRQTDRQTEKLFKRLKLPLEAGSSVFALLLEMQRRVCDKKFSGYARTFCRIRWPRDSRPNDRNTSHRKRLAVSSKD